MANNGNGVRIESDTLVTTLAKVICLLLALDVAAYASYCLSIKYAWHVFTVLYVVQLLAFASLCALSMLSFLRHHKSKFIWISIATGVLAAVLLLIPVILLRMHDPSNVGWLRNPFYFSSGNPPQ